MKTSYPEFYHYLMENTDNCCDLMQQLKSDINADKELWSDMEVAFGLQKTVDIPVLGGWISTVFCIYGGMFLMLPNPGDSYTAKIAGNNGLIPFHWDVLRLLTPRPGTLHILAI